MTWLVSAQAFAQVINEIHFHPACAVNYTPCPDAPIEFIELYNPTSLPIDLSGLHFIDGIEFEFGDDDTLGAGAYLVLADDAQGFAAHFGFAPFAQWAGKLSNKGETITLADANGIRDRVRYEDGSNTPGEFSVRADGEGPSLQLTDASADNERSRYWQAATPTPGANNANLQTPATGIENLSFTLWPEADTPITVAVDVYGSSDVVLRYLVNIEGGLQDIVMSSNDGLRYSAEIPTSAFDAGDLVRFQVLVDNFQKAPASDDTIEYLGTTIRNPANASALPVLEWFTSDANYNAGYDEEGDQTYPGVIAIEGHIVDGTGFRIRGAIARSNMWSKRNWKFKLPKHHSIEIPGIGYPLDTLDVQGGFADETRVRELVGHRVAKEMGLVAAKVKHIRVEKNGVFFGLHTLQEHPEGGFLKDNGLDNATLYKGALPFYYQTPQNGPAVPAQERATFENWDIPNYINVLAAGSVLQHNDFAHGNFYWWYNADKHGRFQGMIWDLDLSQGIKALPDDGLNTIIGPASLGFRASLWSRWRTQANPLLYDVLTNARYREMYLRRVQVLSDEWLGSGRFETMARDAFAEISPEWELDTDAWGFWGGASYSASEAIDRHSNAWIDQYYQHLTSGGPDGDIPGPQPLNPNISLVVHPTPQDPRAESIELFNLENVAIDVSGWRLVGDVNVTLPPGSVLPRGRSAFVVDDDSPNGFRAVTNNQHVLTSYGTELNDLGGRVSLLDQNGAEVFDVTWGTPPNPGLILNEWNAVSSGRSLSVGDSRLGSVVGNGGDWFELVVVEDLLDIRGWTLDIVDDDLLDTSLTFGESIALSALPIGTIITISEGAPVSEEGVVYNEDPSFDVLSDDYWVHLVAGASGSGQYISANNFKVSNDNWQLTVIDQNGQRRFGAVGEGIGSLESGGIRADQVGELEEHPSADVSAASLYDDGDGSTFGEPNMFDNGFQNFAALRDKDSDGQSDEVDPCPIDAGDDSDGDGSCDSLDICAGFNDNVDTDADGLPDGCDVCPLDAPEDDDDDDGVCDSDDLCEGFDDNQNTDGDGAPDGCDLCPLDALDDSDGDGSCDSDDLCLGFDDNIDGDGDGVPDLCDDCPLDFNDDGDDDGICDSDDRCADFDDSIDGDADGSPDFCDVCPLDANDDSDNDGSCDSDDICPGFNDNVDRDSDGLPDGCDACPLDALNDADNDGRCASEDTCEGFDDALDPDGDGIPTGCDRCPLDAPNDTDADGICDSDDICAGFDDRIDTDGDGIPNGCDTCSSTNDSDGDGVVDDCDPCPNDENDDSDGDGSCDENDLCPGFDDSQDRDGDLLPDACDLCPDDRENDNDGDGVCNRDDLCPGFDDNVDGDGDGTADGCDFCPLDALDDSDGDGACDSVDLCPNFNDGQDQDADGVPDACDFCPQDSPDDSDGDGVCESDDRCLGFDDRIDSDGDGVPNACDECVTNDDRDDDGTPDDCDLCPDDADNDSDGDGRCFDNDTCVGFDDRIDSDGDGVADGCDLCPDDAQNACPQPPQNDAFSLQGGKSFFSCSTSQGSASALPFALLFALCQCARRRPKN